MKSSVTYLAIGALFLALSSCSQPKQTQESAQNNSTKESTESSSPADKSNSVKKDDKEEPKTEAAIAKETAKAESRKTTPVSNEANENVDAEQLAAKELEATNSEYAAAITKLNEEIEKLASDAEKQALFQKKNPEPAYTARLFALLKKYPSTDSAFTAGMTIILEYPTNKEFPATMDLILDHHGSRVEWQKIAGGYLELVPSLQVENWMRKMIKHAANDAVKVQMTYLLYRYFDQFPTFASTIEYNPQIKKRFSKDQIDYIYNRKQAVRDGMLVSLKELKEKYSDVVAQGNRKVKDVIDGPIFELEHLQVGSIAPDIVGKDFDGIEFRLSDYRGKVVMLDFWGQWCPPCRDMFPHERELIEELVGKPFVLIGVNSDRRLETAVKATKQQNLVWRNFWCGPQGRTGPIAKKWNVSAWPTVYLIDGEGVIRYKEVLGRDIDKGIEALLAEMGHKVSIASTKSRSPSRFANRKSNPEIDDLLVRQK